MRSIGPGFSVGLDWHVQQYSDFIVVCYSVWLVFIVVGAHFNGIVLADSN